MVEPYVWSAFVRKDGTVYGYRTDRSGEDGVKRTVFLHRAVMGFPKLGVDHRDRDGLNCVRSNLREATQSQNLANRKGQASGQLKGIWKTSNGRWVAEIKVLGVRHRLGRFTTPALAHEAYMVAARAHFGEFARAS